jgi:hypothetical protein
MRMRWAEHAAHMRIRYEYKILSENLKGVYHLGDINVNGKAILK